MKWSPFRWLLSLWYAHLRRIDRMILWPICKREAAKAHPEKPLDWARAAFALHAMADESWRSLGQEEIIRQIEALE